MRCSILGLGWYGEPLARELKKNGWHVSGSTRTPEKKLMLEEEGLKPFLMNFPKTPTQSQLDQEVIILNIPPFERQLDWLKSWPWSKESWVIFISSTSVLPFPDTPNASILAMEERWVQETFTNWTILRFGGLLGGSRHPGKFLSGRKNLQGKNWPVNLIHQKDAIGVTKVVLEKKLTQKIFNVVSSEHPTREEYYSEYCRKNGLPLPEFSSDESVGKIVSNEDLLPYYSEFQKLL